MPGNKPDDFQCASHNRKLDWHRFYCVFEDRPQLRWPLLACLVIVVLGVMIIGIVSTVQYTRTGHDLAQTVELKEGAKGTQNPASVVAMDDSIKHDNDNQNANGFASSQNPADITMCDDELHGCQSFNVLNVCCSSPMFCYRTNFSDSGVYCCDNSTTSCEPGPTELLVCEPGLTKCSLEQGGGCCPSQTDCSFYGCLEYDVPSGTQSGLLPEDTAVAAATPNATTYKFGEIASSSSRATRNPMLYGTIPQIAHILTFVAVFVMIRRLFLG
ncbi:hypothetical protein PG993_007698 [Apiospora rasikravindrae]|uniref:Uncharacterized protein n=1 Tax=Apiospora rasikravindrae TaxID=990691 RepID=A0ABR1SY85_9PEZI